ncbi:MAG TPA: CtsR family transcriptional regulator [Bacillota bacterium]|nr:CtsR family transcriptional regulator [Bacillota bacterium]HOR86626.1 CtsR family transcriptional regulator [Bacillota bacterium]HPL54104.1 CtsR family transcriptional regulator [Bacillota bacterium]
MSRISDLIENFISEMMEQGKGVIEIQRNEMANQFDCAPSQINYVLMTRFTTERGYFIESRRGGGGCIKITRVDVDKEDYLLDMLSKNIGSSINKERAFTIVEAMYKKKLIDVRLVNVLKAASDDSTLSMVEKPYRDNLRAEILKAVIVAALID